MIENKRKAKGKLVLAFSLFLFFIIISINALAAQDFIIENKTSALFIVK